MVKIGNQPMLSLIHTQASITVTYKMCINAYNTSPITLFKSVLWVTY